MAKGPRTPYSERTAWARNLAAPVRSFMGTETAGATALLAAAVAALVWANSPWPHSYETFWQTHLSIRVGATGISTDLRHWVNEGLMTFFFLVAGLEAKREMDMGEMREHRRLAVPVVAALGGMAVPVGIYLALNAGGAGAHGWGAAMSTDTAFALGALALLAPRGAGRLRTFLLTLAVVDDVVALIIIAVAYSGRVSITALGAAAGLVALLLALRYVDSAWRTELSIVVAVALWVALFESGVDPVVAGLAIGLATSAYPPARDDLERATAVTRSFREQPTPQLARSARRSLQAAISPNDRLQYSLHPWASYVVVPLFGLANAGIHLNGGLIGDAVSSPITLGIVFGYVVGKPIGILGAAWVATRQRLHGPRPPVAWPYTAAGSAIAGIGFTVSLLICSLAFTGLHLREAKLGVLAAAVLAPLLASALFAAARRLPNRVWARQLAGTAGELLDLSDDVDPARDHVRGPDTATVTLVEYGDFECPYCGQAEAVIRELLSSFGHELRYVWRHLPLNDVHMRAQVAAEASEAAADQGAFWEIYDRLLAAQETLDPPHLREHAAALGLDVEGFWSAVSHHEHAARIAEDVASADSSGVAGTPAFFINGRRHNGAYDVETLSAAVAAAGRRAHLLSGAREQPA
jgi:Na+/H+ antiporter NhaA